MHLGLVAIVVPEYDPAIGEVWDGEVWPGVLGAQHLIVHRPLATAG